MRKFIHIVLMIGAFFVIVALALTTFEGTQTGGDDDAMKNARAAKAAKKKVRDQATKQEIEDEIEDILENGKE